MENDDWMIPRRLHAAQPEEIHEQLKKQAFTIDPQFLRQRELRKQRLSPQPSRKGDPWLDFDRSIARSYPAFGDRMWTLGDTARWMIERTVEAVDGISIDQEKLLEVLPEIHAAFCAGEVSIFANTENDPVPRELPSETWSVYQLVIEERDGLIRIFPMNSSSSDYEQHLLNVRVKRDDVLQRWPARTEPRNLNRSTTVGAENQCRRWLAEMMKAAPSRPRPKDTVRREGLAKFSGLSKRGFDRAWDTAIRETNARSWGAPGRRS